MPSVNYSLAQTMNQNNAFHSQVFSSQVATIRKVIEIVAVGARVLETEDLDLNLKAITSPLARLFPIYAMETQNHLPVEAVARLTRVMPATRTKNTVGNSNHSLTVL